MRRLMLPLMLALSTAGLAACSQDGAEANEGVQTGEAKDAAGDQTIAAGIDQNGRFFQAAKAAGLDATLAGPGPYTVLVPADAAFEKLPAGTSENWLRPESRAELTGILTYHILPGVVLAEDIGKAIDNADGSAVLATMGGGTVTAKRQGDAIVLTDSAGTQATITQADQRFSNGVVHHVDSILMPAEGEQAEAEQGQGNAAAAQ